MLYIHYRIHVHVIRLTLPPSQTVLTGLSATFIFLHMQCQIVQSTMMPVATPTNSTMPGSIVCMTTSLRVASAYEGYACFKPGPTTLSEYDCCLRSIGTATASWVRVLKPASPSRGAISPKGGAEVLPRVPFSEDSCSSLKRRC